MANPDYIRSEVEVRSKAGLSPRREQVLELLAQGYQTKEIAQNLGISPETTKCHINALCDLFAARNRIDLVSQGWMHGILQARTAVRALVVLLMILSAGPAIRSSRTVRPPAQRTVAQYVRGARREGETA